MIDRKLIGIVSVLAAVVALTAWQSPHFLNDRNIETLLYRTSLYGIISIGAAFVIVTGGIDLSIGSLICLVGLSVPYTAVELGWPILVSLAFAGVLAIVVGLFHGLLVTRLDLQPFVVTLCGLLLYRGVARWITEDRNVGFGSDYPILTGFAGQRWVVAGDFAIRPQMVVLVLVAVIATLFMTRTIHGRYLLALGRNREAARLSGIPTNRMIVVAYVVSAALAGLGGLLFVLDGNGGKATSLGNFYELYAIAGAVLGGTSLRGGEVSIPGVVLGAGLMQVLWSAIRQTDISTELEFAVVGGVILAWVVAEEWIKRVARARRPAG